MLRDYFRKIMCVLLVFVGFAVNVPCAYAQKSDEAAGVNAPSAILLDAESGSVLCEKNSHEKRSCASLSKVMLMLLAFEAIDSGKTSLDTMVTASPIACAQNGADIWLVESEQLSVEDLIKAVAMVAANDAAAALAEHLCGSIDACVKAMNDKAAALSLKDTSFKNITGDDADGNYSSAYDLAVISKELVSHKKSLKYTSEWLDYIRDGATQLVNTNNLVKSYDGMTGLRTGTTTLSGACMAASAQRDDMSLVAVVLGDKTSDMRFSDIQRLLDYGFSSFSSYTPQIPPELPTEIPVEGGMEGTVKIDYSPNEQILMPSADIELIEITYQLEDNLQAPISSGQQVGTVTYTCKGRQIAEYWITAGEDSDEVHFFGIFKIYLNDMLCIFG